MIPSSNIRSYRSLYGTSISSYKAFFELLEKNHRNHFAKPKSIGFPQTLTLLNPKDELERIKSFLNNTNLTLPEEQQIQSKQYGNVYSGAAVETVTAYKNILNEELCNTILSMTSKYDFFHHDENSSLTKRLTSHPLLIEAIKLLNELGLPEFMARDGDDDIDPLFYLLKSPKLIERGVNPFLDFRRRKMLGINILGYQNILN